MRLLCFIAVFAALSPRAVAADEYAEVQVKAAMVYNFIRFVEWRNDDALVDGEVDLCLIGEHPVEDLLARMDGKPAAGGVIRFHSGVLTDCDAVFVPADAGDEWVLEGGLIIGDGHEFAKDRGVIGLIQKDGRMRFEVNIATAKQNDLVVSSKLLSLADRVYE